MLDTYVSPRHASAASHVSRPSDTNVNAANTTMSVTFRHRPGFNVTIARTGASVSVNYRQESKVALLQRLRAPLLPPAPSSHEPMATWRTDTEFENLTKNKQSLNVRLSEGWSASTQSKISDCGFKKRKQLKKQEPKCLLLRSIEPDVVWEAECKIPSRETPNSAQQRLPTALFAELTASSRHLSAGNKACNTLYFTCEKGRKPVFSKCIYSINAIKMPL